MTKHLHPAALLLALAGAIPEPTAAQDRREAVFVSPNVVCRVAPSPSADVAGILRPMDSLRGFVIEVERTETSADGEEWIWVSPAYTKWASLSEGCWVPESVLAPVEGRGLSEANLLFIADRLLTAPEGGTLADLLAVYNLFGDRRYREQVAESSALGLRQRDLLDRALQLVEAGRLAERDPLVLAWLESLGDEAGAAMPSWTTPPRESADGRELAIIAPDVACRAAPAARGTLRGATLRLDHHFTAERADTTVSGEDWTFVWDGCWVPASETAPGDTDEHIRAIVDRFISADDGRSTGNLLRVYNVLSGRKTGHRDAVDASGLLSLRRLELIDDWLGTFTFFNADPLTLAVVRSLEEEVAYFEPGGMWTLRDDAFLTLYERHRGGPEAHEVLWKLANAEAHNDCEGDFACFARALILNRVGRYWVEYPGGPHVTEAVTRARDRLQWWLDGCRAARDAEPGSREARWSEVVGWEGRGEEAVAELRRSLGEVAEEVRRPLVEVLDGLEGCAGGGGA